MSVCLCVRVCVRVHFLFSAGAAPCFVFRVDRAQHHPEYFLRDATEEGSLRPKM